MITKALLNRCYYMTFWRQKFFFFFLLAVWLHFEFAAFASLWWPEEEAVDEAFWDTGGPNNAPTVMATNIEQIFRDFVMSKIKEIEDETQEIR